MLSRDVLRSAAMELLQFYGRTEATPLELAETSLNEPELAVAVSFSGPSLHGTLALAAPRPVLCALSPLRDSPRVLEHRDWIGELGNQLLGRMKNKLVPYGIALGTGRGAVLEGYNLRLCPGGDLIEERLHCAGGVLRVWLDAHVNHDRAVTRGEERAADEGSVLLF